MALALSDTEPDMQQALGLVQNLLEEPWGKGKCLCVTDRVWCWHHWEGHGGEEVPLGTVITDTWNGLGGKGP